MEDFKFSTLEYSRPDCEGFAAFAAETRERIEKAGSYAEAKEAMLAYDERGKDFFHSLYDRTCAPYTGYDG